MEAGRTAAAGPRQHIHNTLHTHTHLSQLTSAVGSWFIHLLTGEESKILYSVQLRQLIYTDKNL